jgi:hypothetical protein
MSKSERPIVEKTDRIDIGSLAKAGAFAGGERNFPWAGFRHPFLAKVRTFRYRIDLWPRGAKRWIFFRVEWTRAGFGGKRPWFVCSCGGRCSKLYHVSGVIACRRCVGLIYECQRRGERSRAFFQACKIRLSLGGAPAIVQAFPKRPKRMWRRTYGRPRCEAEELEAPLRKSRLAKRAPDYERHRSRD